MQAHQSSLNQSSAVGYVVFSYIFLKELLNTSAYCVEDAGQRDDILSVNLDEIVETHHFRLVFARHDNLHFIPQF